MKHLKFLAAVCCMAAMTFVSCKKDKTDEPKDPTTEQNGGNQKEDETPDPVTYTLTVLSSDEAMGTVTGGGTYEEGTEVTLTATPTSDGYAFVKWSDENTDNPRTLTVTGNLELTAIFDYVAVDLGLSVKWATCNVGASKPEEYGDYYAWGETEPKTTYSWATYKWCNGSNITLTKYNTKSSCGTVDNKTVLELADDAARVNWGGAWRMPTDDEWTELRENCTWTWTDDYNGTGVKGRIVTSKTNGNSIFLPAAGFRGSDDLSRAGDYGYYWSSSLYTDHPNGAWDVGFYSDDVRRNDGSRFYGCSVRPVR